LDKQAYFFQGDNLLFPANAPVSQAAKGFPLELSREFINPDIFEMPSINGSEATINVVSVLPNTVLPPNWKSILFRQVLAIMAVEGDVLVNDLLRACHITHWRRESLFCGTCGTKNNDVLQPQHRCCPECGRLEFPRICPAVIVIITDAENRILLAHNKKFRAGLYSHISGFNEAGESLEETVIREVREEINIEIKDIKYVKSQSWPFPNSLMVGFKALYASGVLKPDDEEIEDVKWFTKDNLPIIPGEGSLARFLIDDWIKS
jgi:NAD+ diphosphatase